MCPQGSIHGRDKRVKIYWELRACVSSRFYTYMVETKELKFIQVLVLIQFTLVKYIISKGPTQLM